MMSGRVMNGPTTILATIVSAVASRRPISLERWMGCAGSVIWWRAGRCGLRQVRVLHLIGSQIAGSRPALPRVTAGRTRILNKRRYPFRSEPAEVLPFVAVLQDRCKPVAA